MDFSWLSMVKPSDWISATLNALSILAAILLATWISPKVADRKALREQQERLLRVLLNTRQTPAHSDYQAAIALLPLDFRHHPAVLHARDAYLATVNTQSPADPDEARRHLDETIARQAEMISAMANVLGCEISADSLIAGGYISQGFAERDMLNVQSMIAWQRIAAALERNNEMFAATLQAQPPSLATSEAGKENG